MKRETVETDTWRTDDLHVVCPRAAGPQRAQDVHHRRGTPVRGRRRARPHGREGVQCAAGRSVRNDQLAPGTRRHRRRDGGRRGLMEGSVRGARRGQHPRRPAPCSARPADPRKEDRYQRQPVAGPHLPVRSRPAELRSDASVPTVAPMTRYRRRLVSERSRARNRVHKTLDHDGLRIGGILSDLFGVNGRRVLDGLVAEHSPRRILAGLTSHVTSEARATGHSARRNARSARAVRAADPAGGRRPGRSVRRPPAAHPASRCAVSRTSVPAAEKLVPDGDASARS